LAARAYTDRRLAAWLLVGLPLATLQAYEDGAAPGYTGGFGEDSCHACHSDNRLNHRRGSLSITGLPPKVDAGEYYTIIVTLAHEQLRRGGLQLSLRHADGSSAGELHSDESTLTLHTNGNVEYLQQRAAKKPSQDKAGLSWKLQWRAPAAGSAITLHIAANAANGDRSALGDFVYLAVAETEVAKPTD